jgi:hypothetical protein
MNKLGLSLAAALAVLAVPTLSFAQDKGAEVPVIYEFPDDGLLGDTLNGGLTIIKVNPKPKRVTLIRPRMTFVAELLKTTETM